MFDVGFSEMLVIGIVALVVIGPERLPRVARTLGVLFGRMQRYVTQVKSDINREMEMADLGKVKSEFENAARSFKSDIEGQAAAAERDFRAAGEYVERQVQEAKQAASGAAPAAAPADSTSAAASEASGEPASPQLELGIDEPPQLELGIDEPPPPPGAGAKPG
jgi:sec-independent protein translocase protein TatB